MALIRIERAAAIKTSSFGLNSTSAITRSNAIHSREKHISPFGDSTTDLPVTHSIFIISIFFLLLWAQQLSFDRIMTERHWLI